MIETPTGDLDGSAVLAVLPDAERRRCRLPVAGASVSLCARRKTGRRSGGGGEGRAELVAGESPRIRRRSHVASGCTIVLVRPLYPENLGAVARAMRVTGFEDLVMVSPGPLAQPSHEQARRMAVGSAALLDGVVVVGALTDAVASCTLVVGTSARAGSRGVLSPRDAAKHVISSCARQARVAVVFGGERSGLRKHELSQCTEVVRIPMVANEPSLNLAQSVMVILYEILVEALTSTVAADDGR